MQFNLKIKLDLDLKRLGLPYWTRIDFMIYWSWTFGKLLDYVTGLGLIFLYIVLGLIKLLKQGCR